MASILMQTRAFGAANLAMQKVALAVGAPVQQATGREDAPVVVRLSTKSDPYRDARQRPAAADAY